MYPQFQEVYKPLKSVMDTCDNIYSPRPLLNVWFFLQFSLRFVHACHIANDEFQDLNKGLNKAMNMISTTSRSELTGFKVKNRHNG